MVHSDEQNSAPQKRLACDRCHMRKLRCFRDAPRIECSRCIQFGYACTYSPPLKSGRPKKSSSTIPRRGREASGTESLPSLDSSSLSSSLSINSGEPIGLNDPLSYPMHLSTSCEALSDQIYLSPQETDSLYQIDSTPGGFAPTKLPAVCPDNLNFKWLDLTGGHGAESHHHHYHHHHDQNQHRTEARNIPSAESSVTDLEWDSGFERPPASVPYKPHTSDQLAWSQSGASGCKNLSEMMHSLSRLQQELVHFRSLSVNGLSLSDTGRVSLPPFHSTFSPINSILKPSQELVDIISQVLNNCPLISGNGHKPAHLTVDRRTLLSLILTPLSLLLSAYRDLLRDIRTAGNLNQQQPPPNHNRTRGSHHELYPESLSASSSRDGVLLDDHQQEEQSRKQGRSNNHIPVSTVFNSECPTSDNHFTSLIPDNLQLALDTMSINRPLQLVLITTIIKHHLTCLGETLHGPNLEIAESLCATPITELRTFIKILLSEAQSLLQ
ncbi:hypothetical protein BGW36DRAFT_425859 [Talaromyces proteolyticus]|uniref:Zn(2)-C6 fungal-type domain-containing protein n=1 Tax=Talaromyces proteolyticus TaxID=1131652 RepID=A0AAD4Q357_9EURO|nr:uncharacterized protein BGW36DRAFT_425859 [Talaromyces proteolyticus]KAH8701063.1 hypothetical protein BGW36DRAFT_425859 [Talaromyces proteolyticus]